MHKGIKIFIIICSIVFVGCASSGVNSRLKQDKDLLLKGSLTGFNNMGSRYQYGDGVARDDKKAFDLYKKAANGGLLVAKTNLGYMFDNGIGVKKDKKKAILLYKSAAKGGEPRGMINLGEMYRRGDHIEKSLQKACMWYDKARFVTQSSSDMKVKWAARGALDKFCNR